MAERVVITGAAGRDFHDFNTVFRDDDAVEVVAFTRAPDQNLGETEQGHDRYPPELAGPRYPDGIPIRPEAKLEDIVREEGVDTVVFSYSDVSHEHVMHTASRALSEGAGFRLIGPNEMQLDVDVPVVAVDAVRTGCGKSQLSRAFADELQSRGYDVGVVREPMPYGDLAANRVQRFESTADLESVTVEEREEYEQHVERDHTVYAGVDYEAVLARASDENDVLVWDGGNNELPFVRPDAHVVLADPLRAADTDTYHPGEANLRAADAVVVNKENSASDDQVSETVRRIRDANSDAPVYHADSVVSVDAPERIRGASVLVVEDGPTLTHGDATYGAGTVAAAEYGAAERLDPRGAAVGSIADVLESYDHLDRVLPAMGYSDAQCADLEATIDAVGPDAVVSGTPIALERVVDVDAPVVDASYRVEFHDTTPGELLDAITDL
ncbi:GTPase [Salarchaeum sp. JOR-1]|uniref:GTPase n=1 Tax=Salarchaeum sp. JOR-1 TaxID=2599399 RepID=UPI0011984074|nr:GTPase [Salarchaeum sp. JOR-1]QDX40624.1 GTPase [Salarchaeum sp. JOR-1]